MKLYVNAILTLFIVLMIWGAISDIRKYILSNKLCLSVTLLYPVFLISLYMNDTALSLEYIGYSVAIALLLFFILLALFAFGLIGGGDAKYIPAISLWAGPVLTIKFLLITTVCGGVVSLVYLCLFYIKGRFKSKSSDKINFSMPLSKKFKNEENNIPYGVAISAGGIYVAFELFKALN